MTCTIRQQIGREGMVATIDRAAPNLAGQHVVLRSVAGAPPTPSTDGRDARTWHAALIGTPMRVDHLTAREIMVADACLHPVSLESGEAEVSAEDSTGARSIDLKRALRFVPVPWAMRSLFAVWVEDRDWRGFYRTFTTDHGKFHLGAHVDTSGAWILQCNTSADPHAIVDERRLEPIGHLGSVFLAVSQMWRKALPDAPLPQLLSLASAYQDHLDQMRGLAVTLPTLHVDGEAFRHLRRRIVRRHGPPVGHQPKALTLSTRANLLHLSVDGSNYACPVVEGSWSECCAVDLGSVAAMTGHSLRGRSVPIAQALQYVRVGRTLMPRMACCPH